jgi:hypothetical protein
LTARPPAINQLATYFFAHKNDSLRSLVSFSLGLASSSAVFGQTGYTGTFGGGPFINATNNIQRDQNSGFTEVVVWNIEVKPNGDLNFNGSPARGKSLHRRADPPWLRRTWPS